MSELDADSILLGPRGRRFCMNVAAEHSDQVWENLSHAAHSPADVHARQELVRLLGALDPSAAVAAAGEHGLMRALSGSVDAARYWEEPDEEDIVSNDPALTGALRPIAAAVLEAGDVDWWSAPSAMGSQMYVQWEGDSEPPSPTPERAAKDVRTWRTAATKREREARSWPAGLSARVSGEWWSSPALSGLPSTSRSLSWLGAAQLMLTEDEQGWERARVWSMSPSDDCRVYEVGEPQDWVALVSRYPLEVTWSRRHDWWRATGHAGEWVIPDWTAVAADHDAVHVSVLAFLSAAGRVLDVGDGRATLLAGWDPDETYWLTGALGVTGSPVTWERREADEDELNAWVPAQAS